ncbi:UPF0549 protein C1D4.09c [Cyberlindnera jadinii]|uniref:UPF0549 protein C1D4.09c n=1 Tax=Cyberlindnera jadinii (strain ATCC 18201 / CBS 1600 / BCRC 20928 / JCM 3617 / NBRC 0987 / NRRL Y-1542) TaxID=983966 RepID=A0A0H5CBV4_CYBJN|nr:UPF0549 protein C1D4.09c [Cyberlindnera jadinii]
MGMGRLNSSVKSFVKESKGDKIDRIAQIEYNNERWTTCQLSNKPLRDPVVSDYKGLLYNKESILEYLVEPDNFNEKQRQNLSHIKSLKDVVALKTHNFKCPLSDKELGNGGINYVYLIPCGDCMAQKCLELNDTRQCPVCDLPYEDTIVINPTSSETVQELEKRMEILGSKGLTHSLKKLKRKKPSTNGSSKKQKKS